MKTIYSNLVTEYLHAKNELNKSIFDKLSWIEYNTGVIDIGEFVIDTDTLTLTGYTCSTKDRKECGTMSFYQDDHQQAINEIKFYICNMICK